jgi:hypothetical protein
MGANGNAERTNDRRQTCRKLGPGVLGVRMETHSNLIASFLCYSLFLTSLFFKAYF